MIIELRLIRHALALGLHGNFARAAEALHLTQPTLSRSIAALEGQLGVRLFDRTRNGVLPTAFGRVLLERGEAMLGREAELRREIGLLASLQTGTLIVCFGPYVDEHELARAIARVSAAHPLLQIECRSVHPNEVVRQVLTEQADLGISNIAGLDREERLAIEPLPAQRIYLACRPGHPLTTEADPSLSRALLFPIVTTRLRGEQAALAQRQGGATSAEDAYGEDYTPQVLVNSIAMARLVAQQTDLLVPGTAEMLADDVAAGRLVRLNCHAPAMHTNSGLLYLRERTLAPAARVFIQALKRVDADAPADGPARTLRQAAAP
jgi:DNA-binding transcriptional LysR family regulator